MDSRPSGSYNRLLNALSEADLAPLLPRLAPIELPADHRLRLPTPNERHTYFIEHGFVSAVIRVGSVDMDVGLVGREGMIGVPTLLGADVAPYAVVVRHPVSALRVEAHVLQLLMQSNLAISDLVIRYVQAATAQVIYNSFASAHSHVAARVARWILMAHDRSDGDVLAITHTDLSTSIGVQRSGVTQALRGFESMAAIRTARGSITVTSRAKLEHLAGPAYGPAEAAYRALIPAGPAKPDLVTSTA